MVETGSLVPGNTHRGCRIHGARTPRPYPAGYAVVEIHTGPDDTWPVGDTYAEVQSLAVSPGERGSGLGSRLMDTVDAELARRGIHDLAVGVLAGNEDAIRFYERRGLRPGELQMWRFGDK